MIEPRTDTIAMTASSASRPPPAGGSTLDASGRLGCPTRPKARAAARAGLAMVYAGIGIVHVTRPDAFLPIMPDWVPDPRDVVLATGLCELAGAAALMTPRLRAAAGWAFAAYAVCVFPANIKHAVYDVSVPPIPSSWWYHGPRLAFQPVFVWWALWATEVIDWPFRARPTSAPRASGREDH